MEKDDWNELDNSEYFGAIIYWDKKPVADYLRPDLVVQVASAAPFFNPSAAQGFH